MVNATEDLSLVRALLAGNRQAFDGFFAANFARLYRFVLVRVGGQSHLAEDIVQDSLCKALRSLGSYRGEATLYTWLCQIARNTITDYWRANPPRTAPVALVEDDAAISAALDSLGAADDGNPELQRGRQELCRKVQVALDALPGHYADALEWKYIDGQSVAEIAARLQQSPLQTQSMLARARNAFRDAFQELQAVPHG